MEKKYRFEIRDEMFDRVYKFIINESQKKFFDTLENTLDLISILEDKGLCCHFLEENEQIVDIS